MLLEQGLAPKSPKLLRRTPCTLISRYKGLSQKLKTLNRSSVFGHVLPGPVCGGVVGKCLGGRPHPATVTLRIYKG